MTSRFSEGVREIEAQREPHAAFWDEWNVDAFASEGPLWVALGDSSSQGIGADDPHDSWIPRMVQHLRRVTKEPWRAINLSMTGAQLNDIDNIQLPRLATLRTAGQTPALLTHLAGANDLISIPSFPLVRTRMQTVLDQLPEDAVVARVGNPFPKGGFMARAVNRIIEDQAATRPFHLFWPWSWPSPDGLAADKFHPGPKGYGYMLDLAWPAIAASLTLNVDDGPT